MEKQILEPSVLYKYREDSTWTEEILRNKQVWLSNAEKLNDPLECRTGVIPESWKQKTVRQMEEAQIMGVVAPLPSFRPPETLFSLSPRDTRRWFKKFKTLSHSERMKAMRAIYLEHGIELSRPDRLFDKFQKQLSKVGIFSLTERPDNELMWSHYARSHTGLALGFSRRASNKLGSERHTLKVTYTTEKPVFKEGFQQDIVVSLRPNGERVSESRMSFDDPVFRAAFSTKSPVWSYEQEWRYIEEESGLRPWPGELTSIVFGLLMPQERRDHYMKILTEIGLPVTYSEVVVSPSSTYEIRQL